MSDFSVLRQEGVKEVFKLFPKNSIRIVGGCVRNMLCNIEITDVDFTTTLLPDEVIALLNKNEVKYLLHGYSHGTVVALINGIAYEITTLRLDTNTDGRHADVSFTNSWETDSNRRDFSINALYLSEDGELFDYHNGLQDIKDRKVRFIGDAEKRIHEDYLRILRFFRFSAHYSDADIDSSTLEIINKNAHHLKSLSQERIRHELEKTFLGIYWNKTIKSMDVIFEILFGECPGRKFLFALKGNDMPFLSFIRVIGYMAYADCCVKDLEGVISLYKYEKKLLSIMLDAIWTYESFYSFLDFYTTVNAQYIKDLHDLMYIIHKPIPRDWLIPNPISRKELISSVDQMSDLSKKYHKIHRSWLLCTDKQNTEQFRTRYLDGI